MHTSRTIAGPLAALLCLLASTVHAQGSDVRGVVSDSTTGEKIPFATVLLLNTPRGTSTNVQGFFLLPGIPPGEYEVAASSIGYIRQVHRIIVRDGSVVNLSFALAPEAVKVGEVVVTERSKRELKEIQTSVQVMDQREMKLVPAIAQEDVFRSIQILPGVVSTSDVSSQFYVRGGAGDQNLILLDGMRIYNPYHALGIFSIFDADVVQTTEVYTGAFPPGFGGRLSSVVNITSRDGRKTSMAVRSTVSLLSSKLQVEGPVGEHLRLFVNGRRSLSTGTFERFLHQDTPLSFYDVFAKATLEGQGGQARYSASTFFSGDAMKFASPVQPDFQWTNRMLGLTGSGLMDDRLYVSALAGGSEFIGMRDPKSSPKELPARSLARDFTVRANATLYTNTGTLYFFGFEFNFPQLEYSLVNNSGTPLKLSQTVADISAWFRTQMTVGRFQFDGGIHTDMTSLLTGSGDGWFQPRLNGSYAMFEDWRLKLSYGRFTQHIITVNNEDDLISLFDAWIAVPEDLPAERSTHYVAGIGGSVFGSIGLDLQVYRKDFQSLVTYNRDKLVASDPDYVAGSGWARGAEASVRFEASMFDILASYALGWTSIRTGAYSYVPRYDRRHSLKTLGVLHAADKFDVSIRWEFGSGLPFTPSVASYLRPSFSNVLTDPWSVDAGLPYLALGPKNSRRLPTYHRLDLAATYRFDLGPLRVSAGASLVNVYDRRNIFYFDRSTGERVNSLSFFPSALLTVEYQ